MNPSDLPPAADQHEGVRHTPGTRWPQVAKGTDPVIQRLQILTICWMLIESSVALTASWRARSPALLAFGSDSAIELLSAIVVLLQFTSFWKLSTDRAARLAGILLLVLAGIVATTSVCAMLLKIEPDSSRLGIAITLIALAIMPLISRAKRKHASLTGNRALAADAVQSATCAYLAGLTLLGLVLNATLHIRWIDPLAALVAIPILLIEGRRALRGEGCRCA
jgi:divalent metal cation (Fe/Co/Zn/Cd) transporter